MGNIISAEAELNYIINDLNQKLENVFSMLIDIKKYIMLDKDEPKNNITNFNIIMKTIDNDGFIWDDYEVRNITNNLQNQ